MAWNMETTFAVSGGTLGFVAFFRDTFVSIAAANKEKWRVVENQTQREDSLLAIHDSLKYEQRINNDHFAGVMRLLAWIEKDAIELHFKHLCRNPYRVYLYQYKVAAESFSNAVRDVGGAWQFHNLVSIQDSSAHWEMRKESSDAFDSEHIRTRISEVSTMRDAYRKIKTLAERDAIEYMLPWKWKCSASASQ
jgi:hypothetical protein